MAKDEKTPAQGQRAYLTKRLTARAATAAFKQAARETVTIMGYNVVAKDGYVVKVDAEGNVIETLAEIEGYNKKRTLKLD